MSSTSSTHLTDDRVSIACFMLVFVVSSWNVFDGVREAVLGMGVVFVFGKFTAGRDNCGWGDDGTWLHADGKSQHEEANDLPGDKNSVWSTRKHTLDGYHINLGEFTIVDGVTKTNWREIKTNSRLQSDLMRTTWGIYRYCRPERDIKWVEHDLQAIFIRNLSTFFPFQSSQRLWCCHIKRRKKNGENLGVYHAAVFLKHMTRKRWKT